MVWEWVGASTAIVARLNRFSLDDSAWAGLKRRRGGFKTPADSGFAIYSVVFTLAPLGIVIAVAIGVAAGATQLGMEIGSAPEGANPETSAGALESGNGPTGINALCRIARTIDFLLSRYIVDLIVTDSDHAYQHVTLVIPGHGAIGSLHPMASLQRPVWKTLRLAVAVAGRTASGAEKMIRLQ
jgi:hypothetical protein